MFRWWEQLSPRESTLLSSGRLYSPRSPEALVPSTMDSMSFSRLPCTYSQRISREIALPLCLSARFILPLMEGMHQWTSRVRLQLVGHCKLDPIFCANCHSLSLAEPTYAFDNLTDHKALLLWSTNHIISWLLPCDFKVFLSRNLWLTGTIKVRSNTSSEPSHLSWAGQGTSPVHHSRP